MSTIKPTSRSNAAVFDGDSLSRLGTLGRGGGARLNGRMADGSQSGATATGNKVRLNNTMAASDGVHEYGEIAPQYASGPGRRLNFRPTKTGSPRG